MSSLDERPFPRGAIIGAGLLIGLSMVMVGAAQLYKFSSPPVAKPAPTAEEIAERRDLRFVEVNGVAVQAIDATTGAKVVDLVESDGFIRVILQGLAFDRNRMGKREEPVFTLTHWTDGRISIEDKTTGISINLGAFGEYNKSAFRKLLSDQARAS